MVSEIYDYLNSGGKDLSIVAFVWMNEVLIEDYLIKTNLEESLDERLQALEPNQD